jgi:hypothetical protein
MPEEVSKLIEDQVRGDEIFLREHVHEENFQEEEDLNKVQHLDKQDETLVSFLRLMKMKISILDFLLHVKMRK